MAALVVEAIELDGKNGRSSKNLSGVWRAGGTTASLPAKIRLKSLDLNFTPTILSSFHVSEQKLLPNATGED